VHGAWHGGWCWAALQAELDRRGVPSYAIDLPGHGASIQALTDLYGDAEHVAAVVNRLAEHHGDVVLVGHSYGGAVISQATTAASAISNLVYLTAFCLDEGVAVLDATRSMPSVHTALADGTMQRSADGKVWTIVAERATAAFYGCCSPAAATASIARLGAQPLTTFTQPVLAAPWKTIPSTYVRCLRDEAIHITHQDLMSERCGKIATLDTDHSPFLSAVSETADILESLAGG
jgi:pimeloyl-ACP methyl ester carboxylesterase